MEQTGCDAYTKLGFLKAPLRYDGFLKALLRFDGFSKAHLRYDGFFVSLETTSKWSIYRVGCPRAKKSSHKSWNPPTVETSDKKLHFSMRES